MFHICEVVMIVISPNKKLAITRDEFLKMDPTNFYIQFGFKKLLSFTQRNLQEYPRIEIFDEMKKEEKCLWDIEEGNEWQDYYFIAAENVRNYKKDLKVQVVMNHFGLPIKNYDQDEFEKEVIPKFKELFQEEFDMRLCFPHSTVGILIHNFFQAKYFILNCSIKMFKEKISSQSNRTLSLYPPSFPSKEENKKRKIVQKTIASNLTIDLTNVSTDEEEQNSFKESKQKDKTEN